MRPLLFVTVGTDHHPFDRLSEWLDGWLEGCDGRPRCLMQTGTSAPPQRADWQPYLPYDHLAAALRAASAVVCHGGPATIMSCRDAGLTPIVVPRRPELGEHVDGHQIAFSSRLAARGEVMQADSRDRMCTLLDRALSEPDALRLPHQRSQAAATAARFGALVDTLVRRPLAGVAEERQR